MTDLPTTIQVKTFKDRHGLVELTTTLDGQVYTSWYSFTPSGIHAAREEFAELGSRLDEFMTALGSVRAGR